jgi:penicillin-binding protein 1A
VIFFRYFLAGCLLVLVAGGIAVGTAVGWVIKTANSAPPLSSLKQRNPGQLSEVFAADGTRLGFIQANDLVQPATGDDLPKTLKQATVAIEDQRFYKHSGVDYEGIVRAAVKNATEHKTVQGGSTLTMQLVRNLYTDDKTRNGIDGYKRKIKEAKLAQELEKLHNKAWILTKYLNSVPYGTVGGQSAIGAGAAAHLYFNKNVRDLTLNESAMLAGMPQAPSEYSPLNAPTATKQRRNEVLGKMAQLGMISKSLAAKQEAKGLGLHMEGYFAKARERYFLDYVKNELLKEYGTATVQHGGLKVYTTISLKKQQEARAAIKDKMGNVGPSAAVVTIDPTNGDIVAMASSQQYQDSNFNLATQGHRQPGSSFKIMALMTALREGVNPNTTYYNSHSPTTFTNAQCGPVDVKTYGGESNGNVSLTKATLLSDNSVYIQLASDLGPDKIKETARMMGITSPLHGYCAETLGGLSNGVSPLEMADAYATIADGGYRNRPRAITMVVLPEGHSDLPARWKVHRTKEFDDGVTAEATKILQMNVQSGTGTHANFGCPAGGKTGTTDNNIDAWFVGFTPRLASAVWVGFPGSNHTSMNGMYRPTGGPVDGGTYPADIWGAYMKQAVGSYCGNFKKPTVPFVPQPFFGHFATSGKKASKDDNTLPPGVDPESGATTGTTDTGTGTADGTGTGTTGTGTTGTTTGGTGTTTGQNGAAFDPNAYESPPQGEPTPSTGNGQ